MGGPKYHAEGPETVINGFSIQKERSANRKRVRWRLTTPKLTIFLPHTRQVYELADLLDEALDLYEQDRDENCTPDDMEGDDE